MFDNVLQYLQIENIIKLVQCNKLTNINILSHDKSNKKFDELHNI